MLHLIFMLNTMKILMKNISNLKLVLVQKYQNTNKKLGKGHTPYCSEEVFITSRIKDRIPWTYVISDINGEETDAIFYECELRKTNQGKFRIEKVIKGKGNKLYVKLKGYDNPFNSWIDKKDIVEK